MTKEATQMGVSKRDQDMEDLILRREAEEKEMSVEDLKAEKEAEEAAAAEELEDEDLDDTGAAENEDLEDGETNSEEEGSEEEDEDALVFTTEAGEEYKVPKNAVTKLKIDGEEIETPADKVVSRYQKGAAGDLRLQTANDLKKSLDKREADLSKKEKDFLDQVGKAKQQNIDGDLSEDDYAEKVKQLVSAVVDADEDAAVELFASIYKPPAQTGVIDEEALTEKFVKLLDDREEIKAAKAYEADLAKATKRFEKEYKDLYYDERLYTLVDVETARLVAEKPNATPWEIISEAAATVQKWRGGAKKDPGKKPNKKSPTPAGGKVPLGSDPKPESRKETLNKIRASRGQPAL